MLHSVASGLLGAAAAQGGAATAALGLGLHFLTAYIIAAIYYGASTRLVALREHAVPAGLLYGFGVYWVMNLVVLPLSAYPRTVTFPALATTTGLFVHMVGIGLPIGLAARAAQRGTRSDFDTAHVASLNPS